jgi:hypothetical protein
MVKGLSKTSETVAIGFSLNESAADTFTQGSVDLNLSPLDREVFVVTSINLDPTPPDAVATTNTRVNTSLTTTSQVAVQNLGNANCLATSNIFFRGAGTADSIAVYASQAEQPPATLDYLGIIATNDFFIQIKGDGNLSAKQINGKLYGYRAKADATIYSALVQSEVLSS